MWESLPVVGDEILARFRTWHLLVAFVMLARLGLSLPRSAVVSLSLQKAASPHFLNGAAGENQYYYYSQPCDRLRTHKTCQ